MPPVILPADSDASDHRPVDARRAPRSRRPGASGIAGAIAMAALAAAAHACTQTQVVLEPAPDAGGGDTTPGATGLTISTSDKHTCAIAQGALYCWGANDEGRLGTGDTTSRLRPTRVGTESDWKAVATGFSSTLALKTDGTMWSFGGNDRGQLGLGDLTARSKPDGPIGGRADWTAIATRFNHACALAKDGSLWCWGENSEGQLGRNDPAPPTSHEVCRAPSTDSVCRYTPTPVTTLTDVFTVDTGDGHTCATKTDGSLWCWGRNSSCQLGRACEMDAVIQSRQPMRVGNDTDWKLVRSGQDTTCGVRGGAAYCWGASDTDKKTGGIDMGIPGVAPGTNVPTPTDIRVPGVVADLSFNTFGGAALDDKRGAWVWGRNREGQLGKGDYAEYAGIISAGSGWTQVSTGHFTTCGVRGSQLVCSGENADGQLGQGDMSRSNNFVPVQLPPK